LNIYLPPHKITITTGSIALRKVQNIFTTAWHEVKSVGLPRGFLSGRRRRPIDPCVWLQISPQGLSIGHTDQPKLHQIKQVSIRPSRLQNAGDTYNYGGTITYNEEIIESNPEIAKSRQQSNMSTTPPLSKATGYGIVVGLGFLFA
jgi:hypothetical protein